MTFLAAAGADYPRECLSINIKRAWRWRSEEAWRVQSIGQLIGAFLLRRALMQEQTGTPLAVVASRLSFVATEELKSAPWLRAYLR